MDINAPTSENTMEKINNKKITIVFGPGEWIENRTDGIVQSIDVIIKGWINDDVPLVERNMHGGGKMNHIEWGQSGSVEESFNWSVPEELQTSATWHAHVHPHDEDNDSEYKLYSLQWIDLIKNTDEYNNAYNSVKTQLENL